MYLRVYKSLGIRTLTGWSQETGRERGEKSECKSPLGLQRVFFDTHTRTSLARSAACFFFKRLFSNSRVLVENPKGGRLGSHIRLPVAHIPMLTTLRPIVATLITLKELPRLPLQDPAI